MNINVALCDDEESQLDYLESIIEKFKKDCIDEMDIFISRFSSAEEFLFKYEEKSDFHIIFLDVEMRGINGVELARKIRNVNKYVQIVFVTGYSEFMGEGYEVEALNYLLKPVKEEKFYQVFKKAMEKLKLQEAYGEEYLIFQGEDGKVRVEIKGIMYVEAVGHQCKVFCKERTCFIKESLGEVRNILSKLHNCSSNLEFIYCHRSYIVNLRYIDSIRKTEIILDNGDSVPLARRKYKEVNETFIEYYTGSMK